MAAEQTCDGRDIYHCDHCGERCAAPFPAGHPAKKSWRLHCGACDAVMDAPAGFAPPVSPGCEILVGPSAVY